MLALVIPQLLNVKLLMGYHYYLLIIFEKSGLVLLPHSIQKYIESLFSLNDQRNTSFTIKSAS
jgi:hypothetical protein